MFCHGTRDSVRPRRRCAHSPEVPPLCRGAATRPRCRHSAAVPPLRRGAATRARCCHSAAVPPLRRGAATRARCCHSAAVPPLGRGAATLPRCRHSAAVPPLCRGAATRPRCRHSAAACQPLGRRLPLCRCLPDSGFLARRPLRRVTGAILTAIRAPGPAGGSVRRLTDASRTPSGRFRCLPGTTRCRGTPSCRATCWCRATCRCRATCWCRATTPCRATRNPVVDTLPGVAARDCLGWSPPRQSIHVSRR
jgi:hypothetical protein